MHFTVIRAYYENEIFSEILPEVLHSGKRTQEEF